MFLATGADGQTAASWGEEKEELQTLTLSPLLGGSSLGGSLGARWDFLSVPTHKSLGKEKTPILRKEIPCLKLTKAIQEPRNGRKGMSLDLRAPNIAIVNHCEFVSPTSLSPAKLQWARFFPRKIAKRIAIASSPSHSKSQFTRIGG